MPPVFETNYKSIVNKLTQIDPLRYASTRNFINGKVTYLSPYISRGVLSLRQVAAAILSRYPHTQATKLLQELAWREYWQRVWESKGDMIFSDLKQPQANVRHHAMIRAVNEAQTGITVIDEHIKNLYETGYLHNHLRMYIAAITCNNGGAHWQSPSRWMYYHLFDGDLASNTLSWQWVAGSFSSKKYYCNQDNVNYYTNTQQKGTFLDMEYPILTDMPVPDALVETETWEATTSLPASTIDPTLQPQKVFVYNSYQLDPLWHKEEAGERILLLEPEHFRQYPVSEKVLQFIVSLAENIPSVKIFNGSFNDLQETYSGATFYSKKHPSCTHYRGVQEAPDHMFPAVSGYFPSFFSYWKKCEKYLKEYK